MLGTSTSLEANALCLCLQNCNRGVPVTADPRGPYISTASHTTCSHPCHKMTDGSHMVTLSSSPQNEKYLQQAPWFSRVIWGRMVWVWFAFAVVSFSYFS